MARSGWQPLYLNGIPRRGFSPLFVLFGILVGLLLGVGFKFEYESDVEAGLHEGSWVSESSGSASGSHEIWLRCVIMVQPFTPKAEKFVSASQDTFGKKCNETLYFTSSSELMKKFSESGNIYLVDTNLEPNHYSFFHRIIVFLKKRPSNVNASTLNRWTVFLNEQAYVVTDNLRHYLSTRDPNVTQVIGRLSELRTLLNYVFPFTQTTTFSMDAGVVLSSAALESLSSSKHCSPSSWFTQRSTGKALYRCAKLAGATLLDPIDKDGYHLFNTRSPRTMFSKWATSTARMNFEAQRTLAACCSDRAISFGLVSYRDQRVMDYAVDRMRVFGI